MRGPSAQAAPASYTAQRKIIQSVDEVPKRRCVAMIRAVAKTFQLGQIGPHPDSALWSSLAYDVAMQAMHPRLVIPEPARLWRHQSC